MQADPRRPVFWPEVLMPAAVLGVLVWTMACAVPLDAWAQPRLASAYALRLGQELYPDPRDGAQLCWLYGPVLPLWLLPATFAPSLAWAGALAVLLNAAAPLLALAWCLRADAPGWRCGLARTGWAVLVLCSAALTGGWFGGLHVDPPCLALMLVALGAVRRHRRAGGAGWLHLAATAAVLACWTKQTAAVFPPALAALWAWEGGRRPAARWLGLVCLYGALSWAVAGAVFGFGRIWFYVVAIHPLLPWRDPADYFRELGPVLLLDFLPWVALALLPALWRRLRPAPDATDPAAADFARLGWLLLPFGVAAMLKEGGGINSAHGLFFLGVALGLRLHAVPWPRALRGGLAMLCAVLALAGAAGRLEHWRPQAYQDRLLAVARQHPGRLYLPWNPLPTLLTDGRIYPFEYALFAREITGTALTPDEIRAALPAEPLVVYDGLAPTRNIAHYLPGTKPRTLASLANAASGPAGR